MVKITISSLTINGQQYMINSLLEEISNLSQEKEGRNFYFNLQNQETYSKVYQHLLLKLEAIKSCYANELGTLFSIATRSKVPDAAL